MQRVKTIGWLAAIGAAVLVGGTTVSAQDAPQRRTPPAERGGDRAERPRRNLEGRERPDREAAPGERRGRGEGGPGAEGRQRGPGAGVGMGQPAFVPLLRQLELTDDQNEKIRQILQNHREATAKWREENQAMIDAHQAQVRQAIEAGDREKARQLQNEFQEKHVRSREAEVRKQVMAVLTADQRQRLEELEAEQRERMEQRRQRFQQGEGAEGQRPRGPRGEGAEGERPRRQRGEGAEGERPRRQRGEGGPAEGRRPAPRNLD